VDSGIQDVYGDVNMCLKALNHVSLVISWWFGLTAIMTLLLCRFYLIGYFGLSERIHVVMVY